MKTITRLRLIKLALSRKYAHIYWFTFQLRNRNDNGSFETFMQSGWDGRIQNAPEIIKNHIENQLKKHEK